MKFPEKQIVLFLVILPLISFTQSLNDLKRDYVWMFGYEYGPPNWGGTRMDFMTTPISISFVNQQIYIDETNASMCDMNGNLLFYTNAMYVANKNYQIMPNGDSLNPGLFFNWYQGYGYRNPQGAIVLSLPNSDHLFYIIHQTLDFYNAYWFAGTKLLYTVVDMNLSNGLGDVIQKNLLIVNDTMDPGYISACRHANGRDWWILIPEYMHNRFYRYLLDPTGIHLIGIQSIGSASTVPELGQASFSPDGKKYVRFGLGYVSEPVRLEVFDFDRCTGLLSSYRNLWYMDSIYVPGIAVSPNSRYMYVSGQIHLDQYDLQAADIAASKITVGMYDGFVDPLFSLGNTYFFLEQLGPDNKIYMCTQNSTQYLHVINHPDSAGLACDFQQHTVHLNTFNNSSLPNFPNYRLGAKKNCVCDSLGIPGGGGVEGKIRYANTFGTKINNTTVKLKTLAGATISQTITDTAGYYLFLGIEPGEYIVTVGCTKPWGGANATDALLIAEHFVGINLLSGLKLKAADVNGQFNINATDALLVLQRFTGFTNTFPVGDWIFEEKKVTLFEGIIQKQDLMGICTGDVDGSYVP